MPGSTPEGEVFWQTFAAGNYDALDQLQTTLGEATKKAPSDGYLQRLLGVSYFWQVAEGSRTSGGVFRDALASFNGIEALEASKAKSPNDPWTPCFLGLLKYEVGSRLGNTTQKGDGLRELARGIELYPEFNTYCRALARGGAPRSSPEFQAAVTDFWRVIELCDPTVTRDHPEVSDPSKMASCTIRARVPHGYNGIWMTMGDVMTKVGDARIANAFYANAKLAYFDNWPEKAALEKRLASQAQNQALFADADTKNDPELAFHSARTCVMCHAK